MNENLSSYQGHPGSWTVLLLSLTSPTPPPASRWAEGAASPDRLRCDLVSHLGPQQRWLQPQPALQELRSQMMLDSILQGAAAFLRRCKKRKM